MELNVYKDELILSCDEAIEYLEKSLSKISLGTANPQMFSMLQFSYYGSSTLIGDVCSITHPESHQLIIKPFDKTVVKDIYATILKQNYGVTVQDEGDKLRIIFPILTTERRKEIVKSLSTYKEETRIKIRNGRQAILKQLKNDKELSEDDHKFYQNEIQKVVDQYINNVDQIMKEKEEQLMKL